MRIGANDELAGKGVLLEDDLVNDPSAGSPEADAVLRGGGAQKVIYLPVLFK